MTLSRITIYLACAVLAAGVGWQAFTGQRADEDERRRAGLDTLRTLVGDVDNKAMSASYGLLPAYDQLVRALDDLRAHTRMLVDASKPRPDAATLARVFDRVEERTRQIEELKGLRSTLSNSERRLRERLAQPEDPPSPVLSSLRLHLLAQRLVPGEELSLSKLQELGPALSETEEGARLAAHLEVVLENRRKLTNVTTLLLERRADSLTSLVDTAARDQLAELEAHRAEANVGRLAAMSLALFLLVASLWLPER